MGPRKAYRDERVAGSIPAAPPTCLYPGCWEPAHWRPQLQIFIEGDLSEPPDAVKFGPGIYCHRHSLELVVPSDVISTGQLVHFVKALADSLGIDPAVSDTSAVQLRWVNLHTNLLAAWPPFDPDTGCPFAC